MVGEVRPARGVRTGTAHAPHGDELPVEGPGAFEEVKAEGFYFKK